MGGMNFGDVKTKKFLKRVVRWLGNKQGIEITRGGRHNLKVHIIHNGKKYPLPTSHPTMNKHIVADFGKWLVENGVCTMEEYEDRVR